MKPETMTALSQIEKILKSEKNGIWIREIARRIGKAQSSVYYYILGQDKDGHQYGGYLKDDIITVKTGSSKKGTTLLIKWKGRKK